MPSLRPIHYKKFEKFLQRIGCHIKSNLRTLRISTSEYLEMVAQL